MASIHPIEFGKNLRPSTVDALNKINEIITVVNELNPDNIEQLTADVAALTIDVERLESSVSQLTSSVGTNASNIAALTSATNANTEDVEAIKLTLYTPLEEGE